MDDPTLLAVIAIYISALSLIAAFAGLLWQFFTWRSVGVRVKVRLNGLYRTIDDEGLVPDQYVVRVKNSLRGTATVSDVGYRITEASKGRPYEAAYSVGLPLDEALGPKIPAKLESYGDFAWALPAHYVASQPFDYVTVQGFVVVKGKQRFSKEIHVKPECLAAARRFYGHPMLMDAPFQHRVLTSTPSWYQRRVRRKAGEYGPRPSNPHSDDPQTVL